jgi:basic amino acid/polyamine antiporter, APA family
VENTEPHLERRLCLVNATSINMSNMVGAGIFVTLPLILGAMGGPQALLGWFLGAAIAVSDALVWSELAAAFSGSGGSYAYLLNSFGRERWGRFWAFLFIFQMIASGPLEIATANIGIGQYASYLWRGMTPLDIKLVAVGVAVLAILLLYRKITSVAKLVATLWIGMLVTVGWVIVSGALHFNARLAFLFPPNAFSFSFSTSFFVGPGSATLYIMYCYLGYYAVCYLGDEVIDPPRNLPRSMSISVITVAILFYSTSLSILGVVPWKEAAASQFVASEFMQRVYGNWAGVTITILILWTAFAATYALMLAYSRIPYAAAWDGNFFSIFSRLHPEKDFPHYSLMLVGGLTVLASFFALDAVIQALMTGRILIQFIGQIAALAYLRKFRPEVSRPFKMYLYPLPAAVAFFGWVYVFLSAGTTYVLYGFLSLVFGGVAFLIMSWNRRSWPFVVPSEN